MTTRKAKKKAARKAKAKGTKRTYKKVLGNTKPLPVKFAKAKILETDWENPTPYDILEDLEVPWTRSRVQEITYPFEGMPIGKGFPFKLELGKGQNVYSASVSFCRQPEHFHKKFMVRKISEEKIKGVVSVTWGCWREPDLTREQMAKKKKTLLDNQAINKQRRQEAGVRVR